MDRRTRKGLAFLVIAAAVGSPVIAPTAFASVTGGLLLAPKAPPPPKKKPAASASAEASASASAAPAPSPVALPSVLPPAASTTVSPLTPRPDEIPAPKPSTSVKPAASYDALMAEIAALRTRVAAVGNAVWKSRLAVTFRARGSHAKLASVRLLLDGAQVWAAPSGFAAEDDTPVFEGGVAPGAHAVTWEIERRDDRDETFRTIDKTTATVVVPAGKTLALEARVEDDSSMGGDFPGDQKGTYSLRLEMKAKAK
jgi:hypothetical protein